MSDPPVTFIVSREGQDAGPPIPEASVETFIVETGIPEAPFATVEYYAIRVTDVELDQLMAKYEGLDLILTNAPALPAILFPAEN